uniref:Uncharacterized protein n=1 Tax=Eucheuma denticulatum TaxID=305493 RepID=A0A8E7PGE2_9FLOR|nr:hypothetical protein [Eucheuma denticulatum]
MNQTANQNTSIYLLLISLEALDMYIILNKNMNDIYFNNNGKIKHTDEYTYYLFNIYHLLHSKHLNSIILHLLNDYCNNIKSNKIFKYVHKFEYIYRKKQYKNAKKNYISKHNINQIAINNLYIIYEIIDCYGFYKFFHYISIMTKY